MQIRDAAAGDLPGIARVHVDSWRTTYRGIIPDRHLDALRADHREALWREVLARDDLGSRRFVVVADTGSEVVGFAAAGPNRGEPTACDAELYAIYLLASRQRSGVGRRMVGAVAERLAGAGFRSLAVWVLAENPACRFYGRLGGEVVATKSITISGTRLDERCYAWTEVSTIGRSRSQGERE